MLLVVFVLALSAVIQAIRPHRVKTTPFDYTLQDSLFKALSQYTQKVALAKLTSAPAKSKPHTKQKKKRPLLAKSIRLNFATVKELERLPSIGPKTAAAIVRYRQEHGLFKTIEELDNVKRIGLKTIERIRPYLVIDISNKTSNNPNASHKF